MSRGDRRRADATTPGPSRRCCSCRTSRSPPRCSLRRWSSTAARSRPCATELAAELEARGSGLVLRNVAGGWRLFTHPDPQPIVERFVLSSRQARLTKAALETLAIVAYKQPVDPPPGERDPGRELRRGAARARGSRADRGGRTRRRPRPPGAVRDDAAVPRAAGAAVARVAAVARAAAWMRTPMREDAADRRRSTPRTRGRELRRGRRRRRPPTDEPVDAEG